MTPHELGTICLVQSVYCYILLFLKCVSILSFQIHFLACGKLNRNTNYASLFHPLGVYYGSFPAHNRQSIIPTFVSLFVHRGHGHNWDINPELLLTRVIIDAEIIECSAPDRTVILFVVGTWRDTGLGTDILFFSRSGWGNNLKWCLGKYWIRAKKVYEAKTVLSHMALVMSGYGKQWSMNTYWTLTVG